MSTMLLSNNLIEPFFSGSGDSKDYFHSFSESIISFSPGMMMSDQVNVANGVNTDSSQQHHVHQHPLPQQHHHHHHHNPHHHQVQHESANSANLNQLAHHSVLSDLFKCADDNSFQEFHSEHNSGLCGPCIIEDYNMDVESNWSAKPPDQWQPAEVAEWIRNWAHRNEIQDIEVAHLLYNQMSGLELCQMQREYFTSVCPQFGNSIFDSLQSLLSQFGSTTQNYMTFHNGQSQMQPLNSEMHSNADAQIHNNPNLAMQQQQNNSSSSVQDQEVHHSVDQFPHISSLDTIPSSLFETQTAQLNYSPSYTSVSDSDRESTSSNLSGMNERRIPINPYYSSICSINQGMIDASRTNNLIELKVNSPPITISMKRNGRRGRPPKKETKSRSKGNGKLWEFIRDLLLNPITNPSFIRWERREDGIFKFIQSDKVAKMWGERKQNPRMTYEKLSRAMRYYYKSQVLLPVFGRRLVYKFGPNATGWRPQFDMVKTANAYSS